MKILNVKPKTWNRSYSNPESSGSLICQTSNWPTPRINKMPPFFHMTHQLVEEYTQVDVPKGLKIYTAYLDHLTESSQSKWEESVQFLQKDKPLYVALEIASDQQLIDMAKVLLNCNVVAVRWVYDYNRATFFDCPYINVLYKDS